MYFRKRNVVSLSGQTRFQEERRGTHLRPAAPRKTGWTGRRLRLAAVLAAFVLTAVPCMLLLFGSGKGLAPRPEDMPAEETENVPPVGTTASAADPMETAAGPSTTGMLEWKEGQFVAVEYGTETSTQLDTSGFTDPSTKNSHDLVEWAKMAWENQWGYVWGTFGYVLTEDLLAGKMEQYPDTLGEYEDIVREKWMGRRVADCVGLIKSYGWYDPTTGGIEYGSGDMPDTGTDGMWDAADVKGEIGAIPDEPGLLVYSTAGHIGVYIGGGYVIEAISHAGGVVKTKLADRPWTGWLQCPYIRYDP